MAVEVAPPQPAIARPEPVAPPRVTPYLTPKGRDLRYDLLRGFFVFAMVVDHIQGPSWVHVITGGNRFFTSAAEGFIFISGLLAGQVYRRLIQTNGLGFALQKLIARAGHLYALAIGLGLVFIPVSELLDLPWAQGVDLSNPIGFILSILTLHRTYDLVDVPLIYALLLITAPLAFILLSQGRTWIVVGVSWLLWAFFQAAPQYAQVPWPIAGNYVFNFSAWQVLFFNGIVIGYHEPAIRRVVGRVAAGIWLLLSGLATAALVAAFLFLDSVTAALVDLPNSALTPFQLRGLTLVTELFSKGDLGIGRLIAFAVVFGFLFSLVTVAWGLVRRMTGWLLVPLGQEALYAYSVHVMLAAGTALLARQLANPFLPSTTWNAAWQLGGVAVIWWLIRLRVLIPNAQNRGWFLASPALAVLFVILILPWDAAPGRIAAEPEQADAPSVIRAVRTFGTPVPKPAPGVNVPVVPLPRPAAPLSATPGPSFRESAGSVSQYVGPIRGTLREGTFYSAALDADRGYFIYLPPDYGTAGRRYPVLYLLHGASGDKEEWPALGIVDAADFLISTGELTPLIIVMPSGDFSYWANLVDDGPRWSDYVAFDLVRHIDSAYRSMRRARSRVIAGLSFGGHGALQIGMRYPRRFGVIAAFSPSLVADDGRVTNLLGTGDEFRERDPLALAETLPDLEGLQIWLDVGEFDNYREPVEILARKLEDRGIAYDLHVMPGDHEFDYWKGNIETYLRWIDNALTRP